MQQIEDWLEKLGLGECARRFVENDIDLSVLPRLTDQDLKDLGVSLGHRRRILAAMTEMVGAVSPQAPQRAETAVAQQDVGERRQLTVMFCDLVGSTALSTRLDPPASACPPLMSALRAPRAPRCPRVSADSRSRRGCRRP